MAANVHREWWSVENALSHRRWSATLRDRHGELGDRWKDEVQEARTFDREFADLGAHAAPADRDPPHYLGIGGNGLPLRILRKDVCGVALKDDVDGPTVARDAVSARQAAPEVRARLLRGKQEFRPNDDAVGDHDDSLVGSAGEIVETVSSPRAPLARPTHDRSR